MVKCLDDSSFWFSYFLQNNSSMVPPGTAVHQGPGSQKTFNKAHLFKAWSGFDKKFMKPTLTHFGPPFLKDTLPHCCYPIIWLFTSKEQMELMQHLSNKRADQSGEAVGRQGSPSNRNIPFTPEDPFVHGATISFGALKEKERAQGASERKERSQGGSERKDRAQRGAGDYANSTSSESLGSGSQILDLTVPPPSDTAPIISSAGQMGERGGWIQFEGDLATQGVSHGGAVGGPFSVDTVALAGGLLKQRATVASPSEAFVERDNPRI